MANHKQVKSKTDANQKDYWRTSDLAFADARVLCGVTKFDLDAAASPHNARSDKFYTEDDDALTKQWLTPLANYVWCNPPFSRKVEFLQHVAKQTRFRAAPPVMGGVICMMIPYEPTTDWFRQNVHDKATVVFVPDGRYNYCHAETGVEIKGCNFASCFAVFTTLHAETNYVHYERGVGQFLLDREQGDQDQCE